MKMFRLAASAAMIVSVVAGVIAPVSAQSTRQFVNREKREWIPWSVAAGRPNINFNRAVGIYVWHDGNRVHILSADQSRGGQAIHGKIHLRGVGSIYDVDRQHLEGKDKVGRKGDTIGFRLDTYNATDGFTFSIKGGEALAIDIDQRGRSDRNVYLGRSQVAANAGVVVLDLRR
jgi:hypothetical protein